MFDELDDIIKKFRKEADSDENNDSDALFRHEFEEQITSVEQIGDRDGYARMIERAFNPVTDKDSFEEYIEEEHEHSINPYGDESQKEKEKKEKKGITFNLFKVLSSIKSRSLLPVVQNVLLGQMISEKVSTYRFHSIRDPKNQAGIFDNKKVHDREIMLSEKRSDEHHFEDMVKSRSHSDPKGHGRF